MKLSRKTSKKYSKKQSKKHSKKTYNSLSKAKDYIKQYVKVKTTSVKNLFRTKDEICKDKFGKEYTYYKTYTPISARGPQTDCRYKDEIRSYSEY